MTQSISGVILAGGENRRFPVLKGFVKIYGGTIIGKNLSLLKETFPEVLISTNAPEIYFSLGVKLIGDVLPSKGPMSGIYSALINIKGDCVFVLACDMPFVKKEIIELVCEKHVASVKLDNTVCATVPVCNGEPQPLFGVYCKTVLPYFEDRILSGKTGLKRLLGEVNTNFVNESDIRAVDPEGRSFVNINTVEDYEMFMANSLQ